MKMNVEDILLKDVFEDTDGVTFTINIIMCLVVGTFFIVFSFYFMYLDFFNAYDVNNINIYESNGELIGNRYLKNIDEDYEKYRESVYDYVKEIHEKDYKIEGSFVIDKVKEEKNKYRIYTTSISGTKTYSENHSLKRKAIIYVRKSKIKESKIKDYSNGTKIFLRGELNNISDKYYVINDIETLEVK